MKKFLLFTISTSILYSYSCNEQDSKTAKTNPSENPKKIINYLEIGKNIALSTKSVLGTNLLETISTKGTEEAITFCNTNAIVRTDSMSLLLKSKIKRVSDKYRNPDNQANNDELEYINNVKASLANNKNVKPKLSIHKDKIIGYYPILTNQACLQCHGNTELDIKSNVLKKINSLYPKDLAINYGLNELRGIWVIEMEKQD